MNTLHAKAGDGRYAVELVATICGPDLGVCISGGTHPHIGAAALGIPCPSLRDASQRSASVSVLNVVGHKEDSLVKDAAHHLASTFNCRVSVCAGLHIDNAAEEDIRLLWNNYRQALQALEQQLTAARE